MSTPPRALKRFKQAEDSAAEKALYSRPEILEYQNKVLASRLEKQRKDFEEVKKRNCLLEKASRHLVSSSSLLYQQLFSLNDRLISLYNSHGAEEPLAQNLRDTVKISENFSLFISSNFDEIIEKSEISQNLIKDASSSLSSLLEKVFETCSNISGGTEADLKSELQKYSESYLNLQNKYIENESLVNNLQEKIAELKKKVTTDNKRIETLEIRAGRNLPYIIFENREFDTTQFDHE